MPVREINGCEMKSIGDASKETGISITQIRTYKDMGLVSPVTTRQGDLEYHWFDASSIFRLRLLSIFRDLGVPLKKIKTYFDDPNFNQEVLLDQLVAELQAKRDKIDRQIDFCKMSQATGLKGMALIASAQGSIDSYMTYYNEAMQSLMPQIEGSFDFDFFLDILLPKLVRFRKIVSYEPTSDEAQAHMDDLMSEFEKFTLGFMLGKGAVSDYGTRILALFILVYTVLGKGDFAHMICQCTGEGMTDYIIRASVYCAFRTLDSLFAILRPEYERCQSDESKRAYLLEARNRFADWVSIFSPGIDLSDDDDILENTKSFLECESNEFRDPKDSEELSQQIIDAWNKLPL